MEYIRLRGGRPLSGSLGIRGAKNSVLPILAGSLLFAQSCEISNCPGLSDVDAALQILEYLGCTGEKSGDRVFLDSRGLRDNRLPRNLMSAMRSSVLFLGPLLARTGACTLYQPGGCCLGQRPIDLHLLGLQQMGAEVKSEGEQLIVEGKLRGTSIVLPFPSVGATENLLMAALGAEGTTTIYNAAREPEIGDLIGFLRTGGARISGAGTSMLQISGGFPQAGFYAVMPDRMETATFLSACAAAGGEIELTQTEPRHLTAFLDALTAAGCRIRTDRNTICLRAPGRLKAIPPVRTAPYPGFPTDAQATLMAAMLKSEGTTLFEENIFSDRFRHVKALRSLGAEIQTAGSLAAVTGVKSLHGSVMEATDLRGGAAMVAAALGAEGESLVTGTAHILRGYENFPRRLRSLGADIEV